MKTRKKAFSAAAILLALITVLTSFVACGDDKEPSQNGDAAEKEYKLVCSTFPQYDWLRVLIGDRADKFDLSLLTVKGTDMHSYQPTAEDIKNIGLSSAFFYIGGVSDGWVEDVKKTVGSDKTVFVNMTEILGSSVLEEETALEEEKHDHGGEEHHDDEVEYDEHIWLSVKNAGKLTTHFASVLAKLDPDGKDTYETNLKAYLLSLSALDAEYKKAVENGKRDTVIFADRFPFLYLMKDYGIKYYAAFTGCSAESEASFKTITALSRAADEIKADTILITETSDGSIADAVISGMNDKSCKKAVMNSMQSVKPAELATENYLGVMKANLETLKKALG